MLQYPCCLVIMATWAGFSDREVSEVKDKLQSEKRDISAPLSNPQQDSGTQVQAIQQRTEQKSDDSKHAGDHGSVNNETRLPSNQQLLDDDNDDTVVLNERIELPQVSQEHQEKLKEENLKRKLRIENALKERCERSSKEVEKLQFVKVELSKIDDLVSQDVNILRERIEEADRSFNKAKQRFDATEKEYVAAKLAFYEAKEKKELLSEHLSTIISHTEMRKALKLKNLMSDLQLEDVSQAAVTDSLPDNTRPNIQSTTEGIPLGTSMISIQRLD